MTTTRLSVVDYGATGLGVDDETAYFTAAIQQVSEGGEVYVPPGTYLLKGVNINKSLTLKLAVGAVLKNFDNSDTSASNYLVRVDADNVEIHGGTFQGVEYADTSTVPFPYYLLLVSEGSSGGGIATRIKIKDTRFVGGKNGLFIQSADDVTLDGISVHRQKDWGCALSAPSSRNVMITNFRATEVGYYEGLKIASSSGASVTRITENIIIDGVYIKDCGKLDPNTSAWQEGIDLFCAAARKIQIRNFNICGCGNGGIEIKRGDIDAVDPLDNVYEDIEIGPGYIQLDHDSSIGIALNWSGTTGGDGSARRVKVHDVMVRYAPSGTPTAAYCFSVNSPWWDVEFSDCTAYGGIYGFHLGGVISGYKHTRISYNNCKSFGATYALGSSSGDFDQITISGGEYISPEAAIVFNSGCTVSGLRILGALIRQTSTSASCPYGVLINAADTGAEITGNIIEGYNSAVRTGSGVAHDIHVTGNTLISGTYGATFSGTGLAEYVGNQVRLPTTGRGWINGSGAITINAANNTRGTSTAIPTVGGAIGDTFLNSAPAGGQPPSWVCIANGGSGGASWRASASLVA